MKYIWEKEDVVCGRVIGKKNCSEKWIIGYSWITEGSQTYHVISLSDGFISEGYKNKEGLAGYLTKCEIIP